MMNLLTEINFTVIPYRRRGAVAECAVPIINRVQIPAVALSSATLGKSFTRINVSCHQPVLIWYRVSGKVASHWPCVTDIGLYVYSPKGSTAFKERSTPPHPTYALLSLGKFCLFIARQHVPKIGMVSMRAIHAIYCFYQLFCPSVRPSHSGIVSTRMHITLFLPSGNGITLVF